MFYKKCIFLRVQDSKLIFYSLIKPKKTLNFIIYCLLINGKFSSYWKNYNPQLQIKTSSWTPRNIKCTSGFIPLNLIVRNNKLKNSVLNSNKILNTEEKYENMFPLKMNTDLKVLY